MQQSENDFRSLVSRCGGHENGDGLTVKRIQLLYLVVLQSKRCHVPIYDTGESRWLQLEGNQRGGWPYSVRLILASLD